MLIEAIKKSMGPLDYMLLLVAVYMFVKIDFATIDLIQKVYVAAFAVWLTMLGMRIYIYYTGGKGKEQSK